MLGDLEYFLQLEQPKISRLSLLMLLTFYAYMHTHSYMYMDIYTLLTF